ncbi:hypothetical protein ACI1US_00770 [Leucobacter sp. BZR 635]|uniref:hypothetical protein n=1 Tax=Leucobacter sp. BZR 635 TaxID=3378705 RepID=UPI003A89D909
MTWWRRNRLALAALALLLPVTAGVMSWSAWSGYRANQPTTPVPVAGGAVNYASGILGPAETTELVAADFGLPANTRLIRVVVPVVPHDGESATCQVPELWERGGERRWAEQSSLIGAEPLTRSVACTDEMGPYELTLDYVVPTDAGELSLAIVSPGALPVFAEIPIISS